ncbi:uncharacterized protein N0V89_001128 [Didymosphaeria variabile]|uniref:RING-type domain-containing protein n=1 Tax=Didymosphaeria variabile TaxID=1932322 RepID=A0A9W8XWJ6_9PLEO|nr:uncharacterized protein N0V89_001128 [Didymosphaeria variabile]KAJ4360563.1 hypothetical protein N0V89_001128 [Didymosphaeria variabile]
MTVFNTETEFQLHGVDHLEPSAYHISQDCDICREPLALVKATCPNDKRLHPAVRIKSCHHVHGTECLNAWLKIGNTCPTCGHMLYLRAMEQPLTQHDVDTMMRELSGMCDEDSIAQSLARYMHISDAAAVKLEQIMHTKVATEETKRKEKEEQDRKDFMLGDDEFLDSDMEGEDAEGGGEEIGDYEDGMEDEDDDDDEEDSSIVSNEE